jgi:hypothetical protein
MSEELKSGIGSGCLNKSIYYKRDESGRLVEKEGIKNIPISNSHHRQVRKQSVQTSKEM